MNRGSPQSQSPFEKVAYQWIPRPMGMHTLPAVRDSHQGAAGSGEPASGKNRPAAGPKQK